MTRIDHYQDPNAPRATRLVPAASAVVVDDAGRLLMAKRTDNKLWTIPGGGMKPGLVYGSTDEFGRCGGRSAPPAARRPGPR